MDKSNHPILAMLKTSVSGRRFVWRDGQVVEVPRQPKVPQNLPPDFAMVIRGQHDLRQD